MTRAILTRNVRRLVRGDGRNNAVVYTHPVYTAPIAEAVRGPLCIYDAHDVFPLLHELGPAERRNGWNSECSIVPTWC